MSWAYEPKGYGAFQVHLTQFTPLEKKQILDTILDKLIDNPILEYPPVNSKMLKPPLNCIRRIHVGKDIVIAYMVCQECRSVSCDNQIGCLSCHSEPAYRVKMIAVLPRNIIYEELEEKWPSWVNFNPI